MRMLDISPGDGVGGVDPAVGVDHILAEIKQIKWLQF